MKNKDINSKLVRSLYTDEYFLNDATGSQEFIDFKGGFEDLIPKFKMVIKSLDLKQTDKYLDIGCGRGELVIYHTLRGGYAVGADFSSEAIALSKKKASELNTECNFIVSTFEEIPEEIKYDKITAIDFIEHISKEEGRLFFTKCFNLLNPGGRILVYTFPNTLRRKIGYRLIRLLSFFKKNPLPAREPDTISEHYKLYHLNEQNFFTLRKMAINAGLKLLSIYYFDESIKDSALKKILINTPFRHLFLKGLTLIAEK
jgi:cyclopropane fatty-acyl-phospholipid synthase-like methyltransferase